MFTSSSEFQKVPGLQKAEITTEEHLEKKKKKTNKLLIWKFEPFAIIHLAKQ